MTPERNELTLGFIPLIDAATLAVARELGFFEQEGLKVRLQREVSWSNIRDKLSIGALDGAHMLAPMPLAATLGTSGMQTPMLTAFALSLNGNAITISHVLREQLIAHEQTALNDPKQALRTLRQLITVRKRDGLAPLTFATVYPFSCHNYLLRYWLAAGGIDPDQDVNLVVIPPPQMAGQLAAGRIDGLCVGEPWNQVAASRGYGHILMPGFSVWHNALEKVLAVRSDWAEKYPGSHQALIRALLQAAAWVDQPQNHSELITLLSRPEYLGIPPETLAAGLQAGRHVFHRHAANFPWRSHALWLLTQMYRWGQINRDMDMRAIADQVYRPDLYREAAASLAMPCPAIDHKIEGEHEDLWYLNELALGSDRFFDRRAFDPEQLLSYLYSFKIAHIGVSQSRLKQCNH